MLLCISYDRVSTVLHEHNSLSAPLSRSMKRTVMFVFTLLCKSARIWLRNKTELCRYRTERNSMNCFAFGIFHWCFWVFRNLHNICGCLLIDWFSRSVSTRSVRFCLMISNVLKRNNVIVYMTKSWTTKSWCDQSSNDNIYIFGFVDMIVTWLTKR